MREKTPMDIKIFTMMFKHRFEINHNLSKFN